MPIAIMRDPETGKRYRVKFKYETVEEQHPDVGFFDRLMVKGWNFHPNQAVRELQEAGLQVERDDDDRLIVKKKDEKQWRFVDPKHFGIWEMVKDALDVSSDVHQVAMESVGAVGGAALAPAHPLAGASAGSAYWGGMAKAMRGGAGSLVNLNAPTGAEALTGVGTEAGIAAMVPSVAKGVGAALKPVGKALAPVGRAFRDSKIVRSVLPKMTEEMTQEAESLGMHKFAEKYGVNPLKDIGGQKVERTLPEVVDDAVKAQPGYKDYIARMIGSSRKRDVGSIEQARSMIPDEPVTFSAREVGRDAMRAGKGGQPYKVAGPMRPEVTPKRPYEYMDEVRGTQRGPKRVRQYDTGGEPIGAYQPIRETEKYMIQTRGEAARPLQPHLGRDQATGTIKWADEIEDALAREGGGRKLVRGFEPLGKVVHPFKTVSQGTIDQAYQEGVGKVATRGGEKFWKPFTKKEIGEMSEFEVQQYRAKLQRGYVGNVKTGPGTYSRPAAGVHSVLAPKGSTVDPSNWKGVAHRGLKSVSSPSMGMVDVSKPSMRKLFGAGAYAVGRGLSKPTEMAAGAISKAARKMLPRFGHLSPWALTGAMGGGALASPLAGVAAASYVSGRGLSWVGKQLMKDVSGMRVMRILASRAVPDNVRLLAEAALTALREGGVAKYRIALHALLADPVARKFLNENAAELGLPQEGEPEPAQAP